MNNSNQYDELLIKYLADDLDAEEKSYVENWIDASEQNRKYFEELQQVWHLTAVKQTVERVNLEQEWDHFQQNATASKAKVVAIDQREELGSEFEEEVVRKPVVYRLFVGVAVAASVLLVIGLGWKLFFQDKQEVPLVQHTEPKTDRPLFVVRHEVNTTGKEKRVELEDGSLIVLANNSEITYRKPFADRRDITLIGKANFKVAKDKTRPFTVTSGAVTTTALGTEFTVTAFAKATHITVRLYEGKIVIKPVEKGDWRMKKDFYLSPGQEFLYSDQAYAKVRSFKKNETIKDEATNNEHTLDDPSIPKNAEGSWFMFNNQSLKQVLDQLGAFYNVKIIYNKKDIQNINWTGNYNRSDSLETILKRIGIVHNLTITKRDSAFIISK